MNASTTIPTTTHIGRSRLLGVLVALLIVAAAISWAVARIAVQHTGSTAHHGAPPNHNVLNSLSSSDRGYVRAITSMSPTQLGAAFGTIDSIDALGLAPKDEQYVRGITSLTPGQLRAAFGTPARATVLASLAPNDQRYVRSVLALTPEQLAAGFGTGR